MSEKLVFYGPDPGYLFLALQRPTDGEWWLGNSTAYDVFANTSYLAIAQALSKEIIIPGQLAAFTFDPNRVDHALPAGSYQGILTLGVNAGPSSADTYFAPVDRFEYQQPSGTFVGNANITHVGGTAALVTALTIGNQSYGALATDVRLAAGQAGAVDSQGRLLLQTAQAFNNTAQTTAQPAALSQTGTGTIPINQDTGPSGTPVTDNLRALDSLGNGLGGAEVRIYLATDWPANPANVQVDTTTNADGRWGPLFVNAGTYVAVFEKQGIAGPTASAAFTVS